MTATPTTAQKRENFAELHKAGCFVIPNPWNIGSARCLEDLDFKAIASTSSGHAHANGLPDGAQDLETVLAHLTELSASVNIPLNADFENGFSDDIGHLQHKITRCVATGIAGPSIQADPQDTSKQSYST